MEELTQKQKREEAYNQVKMFVANDWELVEETPDFFTLKKDKLLNGWLVFFGLLSYVVPGLIYIAYIKSTPHKKKVLK